MSLPELREADAPPAIAAIYAALRDATGVPQVNLIWRHAATLPGVLDWLWAQARPRWRRARPPARATASPRASCCPRCRRCRHRQASPR